MKKLLLILLLTILTDLALYSQDTIVRANGEKIICRVQRENNNVVFYTTGNGYNEAGNEINRSDIREIKYTHKPTTQAMEPPKTSFGLGIGMDYGGFGANLLVCPQRNFGIFGGIGYAIVGLGYNVGLKIRFISAQPKSKASAYALAMYGYNAAVGVANATEYNKLFYGPTLCFGVDFNPRKNSYWTLALLIPIRGSEVENYMDDLKNNHGIEFKSGLMPVALSLGYRFNFD